MKTVMLPDSVLERFALLERCASAFSLVGIAFIVFTYMASSSFHKPINRLVFYASLGNIFTNAATIMSRNHIHNPMGAMCQFQAFLIQMFMPADAYWTLAMACNVWLTFYRKYDKSQLRSLEKYYMLLCYGIPLLPAVVFFGVKSEDKGRMYGNATLWCWISNRWDIFRIALFYGPVWFAIIVTMIIYARAGKDIYVKRKQLRQFITPPAETTSYDLEGIQRTTDISVNYEVASPNNSGVAIRDIRATPYPLPQETKSDNPDDPKVTTNISCAQQYHESFDYPEKTDRKASVVAEKSFTVTATRIPNDGQPPRKYSAVEANTAIWSYTKVSLLFFLAMMITWIPSSANRVYSVVHPNQVSVALSYASALVLPLQGLWNSIIYTTTSLSACRELWANTKAGQPFKNSSLRFPKRSKYAETDREHHGAIRMPNTPSKSFFVDEGSSTAELQSRPNTQGSSLR